MNLSVLSFNAQKEVDKAIRTKGLRGIGYYSICTRCSNCKYDGYTPIKMGEEIDSVLSAAYCIKCGVENQLVHIEP